MAQQLGGRQARYKRILLKLSGEALMGTEEFGIDPKVLDRMALEVGQLVMFTPGPWLQYEKQVSLRRACPASHGTIWQESLTE